MTLGFPVSRLGDCLREPPSYGANVPALPYSPDLPRYVRITDVDGDGRLKSQGAVSIRREDADGCVLVVGDVLFARSGATVGKTYLHAINGSECAFAGYLVRVRTNPQVLLPEFLAEYLRTDIYWLWINRIAHAGAQPNISAREYTDLPVPCPGIAEQRRIVEVLSPWLSGDAQIQALISAKQSFMRGLMQEMLTAKRRFKEFKCKPWQVRPLGDLFDERVESGRTDLPLLSITADRGVIPRDDVERKDTSNADKSKYLRIVPGDIGYNTMRMWQGVSALSAYEGIVSPAYTICIPKPIVHPAFAAYLFKLPAVIDLFRRHSQGLVDDTLNLKYPHFARIEVSFPHLDEQQAVAETLQALDREIDVLERQRNALGRQRRGVAELLLTGKVRIPA